VFISSISLRGGDRELRSLRAVTGIRVRSWRASTKKLFAHRRLGSIDAKMSRAFHPPDTLSKDEIRTIADVRRDIWTNGFAGLGVGTVSGYALYSVAKLGQRRGFWKAPFLNRNVAFLSALLGGAVGSFVMATTTGKNEVHQLHPIFQAGARTPKNDDSSLSAYEMSLLQAKERDEDLRSLESQRHMTGVEQDVVERVRRERNRLYRRATLTKSMEQGGLSDSHGGRWVPDEEGYTKKEEESTK
jgi:hypothetical protein